MRTLLHVTRRELAARWLLLPAAIAIGALAMIAIHSIGHVRGDADGIMNGTWVGTLVVSTIVGMSLLGEELSNSRLSFYFARPLSPYAIFGGKLAAGVLLALFMQIAIVILVAVALPELSWRGSALAQRDVLSVGGERVLSTIGCTLLGMAASIALGSKTRWFVVDALGLAVVGVTATWFALSLEPDPGWLPADSIRSPGEMALMHAIAFAIAVVGLGVATVRALVLGRTDRVQAHRTMSMTLWPIVVPAMLAMVFISKQTTPRIPEAPVVPAGVLVAPKVETDKVVATDGMAMPYLLVADENGVVRVGAAASWNKFDAKRVRLSKPTSLPWDLGLAKRFMRVRFDEGTSGDLAVASIPVLDRQIEGWSAPRLAAFRRPPRKQAVNDRYAIAATAERARQFLNEQAGERTRDLAILGLVVDSHGLGYPRRHSRMQGMIEGRVRTSYQPMLLAPPTLKAVPLLDLLATTGAWIAVSHANTIRRLRLNFRSRTLHSLDVFGIDGWIEVRISKSKTVVEAVPGTPSEVADLDELAAAIQRVREARGLSAGVPVDVLIDTDVDMQRLVDILTAIDLAGVKAIGIGPMPGLRDLALRGRRIPNTSMREKPGHYPRDYAFPYTIQPKVNRCYDQALARDRELAGVMNVKFFVESDGSLTSTTASGVDPVLADCVVNAFRTLVVRSRNGWKPDRGPREFEITFRP